MSKSLADKINETKHGGKKIASRGDTTWCDPNDVHVVTDPNDKNYGDYYDERVTWPLSEERIADLVLNTQINAVKVLVDGTNVVVIGGKRRTLHIREINRRYERGLTYDPETQQWTKKTGAKQEPMQLRIEKIPAGLSMGEIQRIILSENTTEPETIESLAAKLKRYSKHSSPAQLRASCGGMSPLRFEGLMAYVDLSVEAKKAVSEGRLKIANIPDIAAHAKAEQADAIAKLPAEATKVDEIRDALADIKAGKPPAPPKERKKIWGRRELKIFGECLVEVAPENKEKGIALALLALFQGDTRAFKQSGFTWLITALETMDKDGEKRRKKARDRAQKKVEKNAKEKKE